MKTVKAILVRSKGSKKYSKGYRVGYNEGKWMGALVVGFPLLMSVITLILIIAHNS
jgi:hypothetical protein